MLYYIILLHYIILYCIILRYIILHTMIYVGLTSESKALLMPGLVVNLKCLLYLLKVFTGI